MHYVLGNHDFWVMDFINDYLFDEVYENDLKITLQKKHFILLMVMDIYLGTQL